MMLILMVKCIVMVFSLMFFFAETGGGLESLRATLQDVCDKGRESEDSVFDLSGTCTLCFLFSCDVLQHFAIISYLLYGTTTILRSHATRQFRWLWVRVVAAAAAQYRRSCRAAPQRRGVEV